MNSLDKKDREEKVYRKERENVLVCLVVKKVFVNDLKWNNFFYFIIVRGESWRVELVIYERGCSLFIYRFL